jgi:protein-S-isoprenylcysteine O-methyltransferase Ste14
MVASAMNHEAQEPPRVFGLLASLCVAGVIVTHLLVESGDNPYLRVTGVILLLTSIIFMFPPFVLLKRHGRGHDGQSYMHTKTVVDQGLYAVVRHPQYLGYIFLAGGFGLLSWHWLSISLAIMGIAGFYLQAMAEERYCAQRFGAAYEHYLQRVPRFNVVLGIIRLLQPKI